MIIYPPLIADTIPAFLYDDTEVVITVPFTQNSAVPTGIPLQIQIKDYFSSTIITKSQTAQQAIGGQVSFSFKANEVDSWPIRTTVNGKTYKFPVVGQYYKIQIAYDDGDTGIELTYSSAVLGKCIDNYISLSINDTNGNILSSSVVHNNPIVYIGNYRRSQLNEPLYSYRFDFKNIANDIIESSEETIWNNQNDDIDKETIICQLANNYSTSINNFPGNGSCSYKCTIYRSDNTEISHKDLKVVAPMVVELPEIPQGGYMYVSPRHGVPSNSFVKLDYSVNGYILKTTGDIELKDSTTIFTNYSDYIIKKENYISQPSYTLKAELEEEEVYTMTFTITTINGYQDSTSVNIIKGDLKEPNFPVKLEVIGNKDIGNNEIKVEVEKYAIKEKSALNLNSTDAMLGIKWDYFQEHIGDFYPINFSEDNIVLNQNYSSLIGNIKINNNIFYTELALIDDGSTSYLDITHKSKYLPQGEYTIKFTNFYYFSDGVNQPYISFDNMELSLDNTNQLGVIIRQHNDINETVSTNLLYNDNTITFGEIYKYGWQENYQGPAKIQWYEPSITTYTDYMFLSDKDKQLKISFNPKVSSMKETILETKQDTIGGKYPIFYRNGQVRYREIPISGLISYLMDDYEQFATNEELGLAAADTARTTNLTNYNIIAERKFREKVLNWLNDGKPKLFRSMTEGTFIVRLMNVSLSPNDTVGRMIWTFSATAYEIDENTYDNLKKHKLIETGEEE